MMADEDDFCCKKVRPHVKIFHLIGFLDFEINLLFQSPSPSAFEVNAVLFISNLFYHAQKIARSTENAEKFINRNRLMSFPFNRSDEVEFFSNLLVIYFQLFSISFIPNYLWVAFLYFLLIWLVSLR